MKKKKWIIALLVLFVPASLFYYYFTNEESISSVSEDTLNQKDFLKDKQAVVYFSTTADQDMSGGGKSLAMFVGEQGDTSTFEMKGLELGNIGVRGNRILLEDKKHFYLLGNGYEKFPLKDYQHTGDHIGYFEKKNGFYALFNSGIDQKKGGYRSDIYWQEGQQFKKGKIPFYIEASGMNDDILFTLSSSEDEKKYDIRKVHVNDKVSTEPFISIDKEENSTTFGQLIVDKENIYVIVQTGNKTKLVKINKESKKYSSTIVAEYEENDEHLYHQTPFSFKRCVFKYENFIYFVDGFGQVFKSNIHTGKSELAFTLSEQSLKGNSLEIFTKEDQLYLLSINHNNNTGVIDEYDLIGEKRSNQYTIKDIPDLNIGNKKLYLYDFVFLEHR